MSPQRGSSTVTIAPSTHDIIILEPTYKMPLTVTAPIDSATLRTTLYAVPETTSHIVTTKVITTSSTFTEASEPTGGLQPDTVQIEPSISSSRPHSVDLIQNKASHFCDLEGACFTSFSSPTTTIILSELTAGTTSCSTTTARIPCPTTIMATSNQSYTSKSQYGTAGDDGQKSVPPLSTPAHESIVPVIGNTPTQEKSHQVMSSGTSAVMSSTVMTVSDTISQKPQGAVTTRNTVDLSPNADTGTIAGSVTVGGGSYTSVERNNTLATEPGPFAPEKTSIATSVDAVSLSVGGSRVASRIISVTSTVSLTSTTLPTTTETKSPNKAKESTGSAKNTWPIASLSLWRGITYVLLTLFVLSL